MSRLSQFQASLADYGVDAALITSPQNRFYLSGFTGSTATLVITSSKAWILTDSRYLTQVKSECPLFELVEVKGRYTDFIKNLLGNQAIVGFEGSDVTFDWYDSYTRALSHYTFKRLDLSHLRDVKDANEVAIMKEAGKIAIQALENTLPQVKAGMTERQAELILVTEMKKLGATKESFDTIVASGVRGALPHGHASDKVINEGEFITFDFGCIYQGYCSDITRTVVLGQPKDTQLVEIYEIVREAQQRAVDAIRPGLKGSDVDKVARDYIASKGYGAYFGHGTGHGLGILVHEYPSVSPAGDTVLAPGHVVTVEPGIYIEGLGGVRIEDDVLVTPQGHEVLNGFTKQLVTI